MVKLNKQLKHKFMAINFTSIILILVAIALIYLFLRFVISPALRIVLAVIILLILFYALQRIFGFDVGKILAPFGISFDFNKFYSNFSWILTPINNFIDKAASFWKFIWHNVPQS